MNIAEALTFKEGDKEYCEITATVTAVGDLKEGPGWKKRDFGIRDATGESKLTAWNDQINLFEAGKTYHVTSVKRTIWEGHTQLSTAKFTKVSSAEAQQPTPSATTNTTTAPTTPTDITQFINTETVKLWQINQAVEAKLKEYIATPNPAMIGQFCRIISDKLEARK